MKRLPKLEYFVMRMNQATAMNSAQGRRKAAYYKSRIEGMQPAIKAATGFNIVTLKAKFDTMSESEKLTAASDFYKAMDGKVQMSACVDLMSKVIGDTLAIHATQF